MQVISGDKTVADMLLYPPPSETVLNYINNSISAVANNVAKYGERFANNVMALYDKYNNSDVIENAKMLLSKISGHVNDELIYTITKENIKQANLTMQRYILAYPALNELYRKNMCSGFDGTYLDIEPNTHGEDRLEYMQVMDGVLQFDSEEEEGYYIHYSNEMLDELSIYERLSIMDTWDTVAELMAKGIDPTSPELEEL